MGLRQRLLVATCHFALICAGAEAQDTGLRADELADRAVREFRNNDWAAAEHDFRAMIEHDPSNVFAQMYLGQTLFRQERFADAVVFFQKARDLQESGGKLNIVQDRILTDQLVMSYGITGDLKKAHALLDAAIGKDPEYPLNYYNLACAYAEEGGKAKALLNLNLAFDRKGNILKGEQMPDPRADSSFQKYIRDGDFLNLMKKLGIN
jgi:predicted Zn-dependent protease